ncbi:hypothetical protein NDN08_002201 [Rhodosorus marinus]|uniref:DUF3253 domain-containing protein n=1 Tax=Rhodosorus marinus TaxID=101924 RepID=A0AAV8UYU1_9RHOD|nr:hypothetical protein NDN08_002201 [Rhodosorus marinus]
MEKADHSSNAEEDVREMILFMVQQRGPEKTLCPSEVARALAKGNEWRGMMELVRSAGRRLAEEGEILITQRGNILSTDQDARGPIRFRLNAKD